MPHHSEARGVGDFSDLQPPKGGDGDRLVRLPGNNPDASTRRLSRVPSLTRRPQPFSLSHSHSCLPQGSKRRRLLATLRVLEAAALPRQPPSLPGSDSEEEEVVERKRKHPKKALCASASPEGEKKRKKKCQNRGPPGSDSEVEEAARNRCHEGALRGRDSANKETGKRKHQKRAPADPVQHLGSVAQTGISVCGQGRGRPILCRTELGCHQRVWA